MENASKALIIAGSVLISIMVISLLVFGYNQLSDLEQTRANSDDNVKMAEYMRRFEQFNRTLYGSELLSLANLQEDYNTSDEREDSGYAEIDIYVTITNSDNDYFPVGEHRMNDILIFEENLKTEMAKYEVAEKNYNNRSVKYYSSRTYREIASDFGLFDDGTGTLSTASNSELAIALNNDEDTGPLMDDIEEYNVLTSIYNQFRIGTRFECESVTYNDYNGRIEEMVFAQI